MFLLNFSHPLTPEQIAQAEALTRQTVEQVIALPVHFDNNADFLPQLAELVAKISLSPEQLQNASILVNPPSLNFITALLLAELHGRMGYFPAILRLRPIPGSLPPRYEVAELLNLQGVRDEARRKRTEV
jgi:hypothetical protein